MTMAPLAVTPSVATQAYRSVESGLSTAAPAAVPGADFGDTLKRAIQGALDTGAQAETQTTQAISGHGNISEVVTAVSKAELALQTTVALRDRIVQAYQDIMRMPI